MRCSRGTLQGTCATLVALGTTQWNRI
jgi:hypothetical protein